MQDVLLGKVTPLQAAGHLNASIQTEVRQHNQ